MWHETLATRKEMGKVRLDGAILQGDSQPPGANWLGVPVLPVIHMPA